MTFLFPAALAALVLVGLPIAIHLLRREEIREATFPALRYLLSDARIRQRRLRLREQILLALRVAAVLLAVLAAARWVVPFGSGHLPPADVVIIIENDIASGAVVDGRRILDAQHDLAIELLDNLGPPDRVWVMPTAPADVPVFPLSPTEAVAAVHLMDAVVAPADEGRGVAVEAAIQRAETLLAARPAGIRRIVVIRSDGARIARSAPEPDSRAGADEAVDDPPIPVLEVDPGLELPENRGITSVEVNGGLVPRAGDPVTVDVQVRATPPGDPHLAADVPLRLVLGGETVAAGRTDAEGRGRLTLPALQVGRVEGWVEIDPDALRLDDRVPLSFRVVPPPVVRIVGEPGRWARLALATLHEGGRIVLASDPLPPGPVRSAIEPLPPLPAGSALLVTEGLVVAIPSTDPSVASRFGPYLEALAPGGAAAGVTLAEPTAPGSFQEVAQARGLPASVVGTEVHRRYRLGGAERGRPGEVAALARLADGSPWILEARPVPAGGREAGESSADAVPPGAAWALRVLGSPLDPAWSDLPLAAAMVPTLEGLLLPGPDLAASGPGSGGGTGVGLGAGTGAAARPPSPVVSEGPPPSGWTRTALAERRGREVAPFLAWLLFVILCTEGWLAAGSRAGKRPDHETSTPP